MVIESRQRRKREIGIVLMFVSVCFLGTLAYFFFRQPEKKIIKSPLTNETTTPVEEDKNQLAPSPETPPVASSSGLASAVRVSLEGTHGIYGIVVKSLKTGELYVQNEHRVFEPASVYKLWIMGVVFDQIAQGQLKEEDKLTAKVEDLNKEFGISEEEAEQTSGTISYTVREALIQMITVSDNYSALLLTHKVGISAVSSYLKTNGFRDSKVGVGKASPNTTPADIALFLEKLYLGKLANQTYSDEMLDLLKWQHLNDELPKYLPDEVVVAHKTGALEPFVHDAGIVYSDFGDYIIVVFTETDSRPAAEERIAMVSKAVYEYFSTKD